MRKIYLHLAWASLCTLTFIADNGKRYYALSGTAEAATMKEEELDGYDNPRERDSLEFEKTKDPALGYVPAGRLWNAVEYTENLKHLNKASGVQALTWLERGPIYDSVGPSNFNFRAGNPYTSGYMSAVLIDTLNDPSGNIVFVGGTSGGVWRCTNFLSPFPNWTKVNDYNETLAIASICQDPGSSNTMYYSTGDAAFGITASYGAGVWKSTDGGTTWNKLPSTSNFLRSFKIICDAAGNIYLAVRPTTIPILQTAGLFRSKDHGTTWTDITPVSLTSSNTACTDVEISSTGRLHASFGWNGSIVNHWYTTDPANVTTTTGWNASTGIRSIPSPPAAHRMELACMADTLYAVTVNSADNADSCYKSIDGGATWTKQNTVVYPTGVLNRQGWYDITLSINPANSNEFIIGGLDAYKSTNSGVTANNRMTYWVIDTPYVHADHHFMQWWNVGSESRIVIGCDGGIFISRDGGVSFEDRNRNLSIKQYYSGAIHPDAGSPYLLAGAQDNGTNQLKNPGLSYAIEVTGGDGMYVHINQQDPQIQFGSYIFNQYRRTTDGGQTWQRIFISNTGLFTNPYDYDDGKNIMYASNGNNSIRRWKDADKTDGDLSQVLSLMQLSGSSTAITVSPYTMNRVFIGSNSGKLLRLDNANTVSNSTIAGNVTNITGSSFPNGFLNCVNTGSSDQVLVAVFTNFGVNNIWYSNNGGTAWSAIDGNLPDMPVRWAVIDPQHDDKIYIATSVGIYSTDAVNGGSTVWTADANFPTVRTDMLKIRPSDNTLLAATYGRGLFTAVIPSTPELRFTAPFLTAKETTTDTNGCKYYKDYTVNVAIVAPPTGDATVTYNIQAGNTATQGVDFDFTSNGSFSSPSNQHVFTSGVAQTKTITIRIYDDAEVESQESFILNFTISGTTDAIAGSVRTFAVTINDNDILPAAIVSSTYTVGSVSTQLGNSTAAPVFDARVQRKRTQILYTASELTAAGMRAGNINTISFNLIKNSVRPFQNLRIKMELNGLYYLVDGFYTVAATTEVKYLSSYSTVNGWNTFVLDEPFEWDGISNLVVEVCYDNGTVDNSDFADPIYAYTDPAATQTQGNLYYQNGVSCSGTFGTVFYYFYGVKPHAQFGITSNGVTIENTLNASHTENLGPRSDLFFYSSTGVLMARIKNLTDFNYGCTQIIIDRAGNASSPFWNNNPANYLMNKTFRILPTNNNPGGQYEVTLYYTQAEVNGWQSATGQSWNNIQLVKVDGEIGQVTPGNPNGGGAVIIVAPVRGTIGNDYSLTYTFSGGFSGFGAGVPATALPVTLLDFRGKLQGNNVVLDWSTSFEANSKGFDIQRSYDGRSFQKIGFLAGAGNSNRTTNYQYEDKEISQENNYYRLRQIDLDGYYEYSKIVLIRNQKVNGGKFRVLTNPFSNSIDIEFGKIPKGPVEIRLVDLTGKVLYGSRFENAAQSRLRIDIRSKNISRGVYLLYVIFNGERYTEKVLKE